MEESANLASAIVTMAAFFLSLAALFVAFQRHVQAKPIIPYEPRQSVPWGSWVVIIPLFCIIQAFLQWIDDQQDTDSEIDPSDFIDVGWINSVVMIGFVLFTIVWLRFALGADARDLGFPRSLRQLIFDVGIGCSACFASLLPVYSIHLVLNVVFEPQQQHQLVEQMQQHRSPQMLLVGFVVAVIAAPLFEEFAFRLLLQGWLERCEDQLIGYRDSQSRQQLADLLDFDELDEQLPRGPVISYTNLPVNGVAPTVGERPEQADTPPESRRGMISGLPHGWTPVLISGTAFGLAHLAHGVSAVPLILFGIVLGYLYQRTHRLAPSIAAHMLFNAFTMLLLWLELS
ncbi:MAG: CPBP family intramembrane metalloprotease [Planctomycetales bacterium]|nr:CPBP family intramembrane metalloprotease [Planctomycetales bacterium]